MGNIVHSAELLGTLSLSGGARMPAQSREIDLVINARFSSASEHSGYQGFILLFV
jgi:hypothetical protein